MYQNFTGVEKYRVIFFEKNANDELVVISTSPPTNEPKVVDAEVMFETKSKEIHRMSKAKYFTYTPIVESAINVYWCSKNIEMSLSEQEFEFLEQTNCSNTAIDSNAHTTKDVELNQH